jgi:membrane protease YdiL (CAAX protease family)
MNSLPPDHISVPHEGQSEGFGPARPPTNGPADASPESTPRLEADAQPMPSYARVDSRTPFRWTDLVYLAIFYIVTGGIIFFIVGAGAFIFFGVAPSELRDSTAASATVIIITQALLSGAMLLFLYVMVRGRSAAPFWQTLGWRSFRNMASGASVVLRYVFGGFALAVAAGWLGNFVGRESGIPMEKLFGSARSVLMLMALGILVAPLVEETIFRGCVFPVIARKFGVNPGIIATGALFGLAHAQQLGFAWGPIVLIVGVGIVLTYVRARAGTVAASYFVHLGYNGALFLSFLIGTGGLRHLPGA